jgi:hypothetical protein
MKASEIKAKRVETQENVVRILIAGRASYANLLEPVFDSDEKTAEGDPKSYKSAVLFHKNVSADVLAIVNRAVVDAVKIGMTKFWGGKKPPVLQLPLNNGDIKFQEDESKYAAYKGMSHLSAKRKEKFGRPIIKAYGKTVTSGGIIESGDWCVWDISFYPFNNKKKGVAVGLNGVTLLKEGERFGGGPSESSVADEASSLYGDITGAAGDAFDDILGMGSGKTDDVDDLLAGL